jgi:hypothetical protein
MSQYLRILRIGINNNNTHTSNRPIGLELSLLGRVVFNTRGFFSSRLSSPTLLHTITTLRIYCSYDLLYFNYNPFFIELSHVIILGLLYIFSYLPVRKSGRVVAVTDTLNVNIIPYVTSQRACFSTSRNPTKNTW